MTETIVVHRPHSFAVQCLRWLDIRESAGNNSPHAGRRVSSFVLHAFTKQLKKEGDAKCLTLGDGGWNARSCDGVFPGFRRLRRRTATSGSSDTCVVHGLAGSTRCCLRFPRGSTPRPSRPFTSTRALAITGGRTPSTTIRGAGSATTAPGRVHGTRRGAHLPTASGSPSTTSRSRAHEKNESSCYA
jgi:hypothetical protein